MPLWQFFDTFKENTMNGSNVIDFDTDEIKVALYDNSGGAPDIDLDAVTGDLPGAEVTETGYTAGGEILANMTVAEAAGVVTVDNTVDITWSFNAGGFADARYAIMIATTGLRLIAFMDMAVDKGNTTGDLTLAFDALGLFTLSG